MGMSESEALAAFEEAGAIMSGHFVLTSGRHSDTYVQCARVLEDPDLTTRLAETMAERLSDRRIEMVAAPAVGGIVIGFAVARALGARFVFTEREAGAMTFRRGFSIPEGARVLVVEDVVTTGGSVAEVIELVREADGDVVGVASLIDRGGPKTFEADFFPLVTLQVASWDADSCDLCASGVPTYSPGSRRLGTT